MPLIESNAIILACPLYRRADLVRPLVNSIIDVAAELKSVNAELLLIVDSPDDAELMDVLAEVVPTIEAVLEVTIAINDKNIGFLKSANLAMNAARRSGKDVILINSDTQLFLGSIHEMRSVAYSDHMIGFVSPRSNNATICTLPVSAAYRHLDPIESYENYCQLKNRLPRVQYAPVAVGFCLYIKHNVLAEFGVFDEIYGLGYNEENDLIMRANRAGYRAVIANHSFVYHIGESSFALLATGKPNRETENARILSERYPEYARNVSRYFASTDYKALTLLDGLVISQDEQLHIGFDLRSFGAYHNGTFEAAVRIIQAFAAVTTSYTLHIISRRDVFKFHGFDRLCGVQWCSVDDQRSFAAVVRIGQPFKERDARWLRFRAPVVIVFMLDTIALDATYLDENGLSQIWDRTLRSADAVFFNSNYTALQFNKRFDIPTSTKQVVALHSTNPSEYAIHRVTGEESGDRHILLVGNKFIHKFLRETVSLLVSNTNEKYVVLGISGEDTPKCKFIESGKLEADDVSRLYHLSKAVIFPSHYEGFGFPIVNAMAQGRPILARRMPVYDEIKKASRHGENIHYYATTDQLISIINDGMPLWSTRETEAIAVTWEDTAIMLRDSLAELCLSQTYQGLHSKLSIFELGQSSSGSDRGVLRFLAKLTMKLANKLRGARGRIFLRMFGDEGAVSSSPFFDEYYYRYTYHDMASRRMNFARHFCRYGWKEGRNPGPFFDLDWYLDQNVDLQKDGMNPLLHYILYGFLEGRAIKFVGSSNAVVLPLETVSRS